MYLAFNIWLAIAGGTLLGITLVGALLSTTKQNNDHSAPMGLTPQAA